MPTSVISNTARNPAGVPVAGVRVTARLWPGPGFRISDNSEVASFASTTSDGNGLWTLVLEETANITPAGSAYIIEEDFTDNDGGPRLWMIQVGANDATLQASLVSAIPEPSLVAYLTQAAGDARYSSSLHPDLAAHDTLGLATQAELDAHVTDTTAAHAASAISFTPTGTVAATDVQAAIAEVAAEAGGSHPDLAAHDTLGLATQSELNAVAASAVNDGDAAGGKLSGTYPNPSLAVPVQLEATPGTNNTFESKTTGDASPKFAVRADGRVLFDSDVNLYRSGSNVLKTDDEFQAASIVAPILANRQTGTAYTLVLSDAGKVVESNNAAANTVTFPPNSSVAFAVGTVVSGLQYGAGQTTLVAGSGVTLRAPDGLVVGEQYGAWSARKIATDEWEVQVAAPESGSVAAHASTHASGGSDPVTLAQSQITNLTTDLSNKQPLDSELTALAGLTSAADRVPYFTGSGTASVATFTSFGRSLVDDADAAAGRTTLALGDSATKNTGTTAGTVAAGDDSRFTTITANRQTASYTLVLADAAKVIEMNVGSANTLTVPPNSSVAFAVGTVIEFVQWGTGQTTLTPGSGVTIRASGGKLKTSAQYAQGALRKVATDEWIAAGDLAA